MSNPKGINQYTKGGGNKSSKVPAKGQISVYSVRKVLHAKATKNVYGHGTAVLAHSTGNADGERYGNMSKRKGFVPVKK